MCRCFYCPTTLWRCIFCNDGKQLFYMQKSSLKCIYMITLTAKKCPGLLAGIFTYRNPAARQLRFRKCPGHYGRKIAFGKSCRNPALPHSSLSDFASNADRNAPITGLDFRPIRWGVVGTNQAAAYGGLETVYIVHTWVVSSNFRPVKTAHRH